MSILSMTGITSGYGSMEVLHDLSFEVQEGKIVAILGPNGAGKTTVLRTLFGLIKPWEGSVLLDGNEIGGMPPERIVQLGMCYVPQEDNIFAALSVQENLEMGAFLRKDDWKPRLEEVFELFPDISDRRKDRAGYLSGGMRQMVAIGRALMLNPRILLLDEPSTGLAPFLVDHMFERIQMLNEQGVTVLLVEQNAQALQCSHYAYVIEAGERKAAGTAEELMADEEIGKLYMGR